MRRKMYIFLLVNLVLSTDLALGSPTNKKSLNNTSPQNKHDTKEGTKSERPKRDVLDEDDHPFWPNRGKKELDSNSNSDKDQFWATRGRRESSIENYMVDKTYTAQKGKVCNNCFPIGNSDAVYGNMKHTREDTSPFWGMRGRRDSDETEDLFWGSRGRRQENEPFWGNRGRRYDDTPFWGNRGRREEEPFWGNRGRREESPFWGNRGRRENDEPFWGNRGRREEPVSFSRNEVRQEEYEPFWGNRGRRKEMEPLWSSNGRRKQNLKEAILNAISVVENDIENLSRLRRNSDDRNTHSNNKSKERRMTELNEPLRAHQSYLKANRDQDTLLDNRMYAEQPHYIIVERSSRSSAEDDPYFISRGKKYYLNYDLEKAVRDRRGAIEEIVKSVRNDPYYIARGKKDATLDKKGNSTLSREEFLKARELICSTIDLISNKNSKNKRDINSERDRRTSLQKLAAQLQLDPYYVSRGKKTDTNNSETVQDSLEDFINEVAGKCN